MSFCSVGIGRRRRVSDRLFLFPFVSSPAVAVSILLWARLYPHLATRQQPTERSRVGIIREKKKKSRATSG